MQNKEPPKQVSRKPKQIHELDKNFKFVKSLGQGQFGAVELFKYVGKDKKIKKMCNEKGEIGVKFQYTIDINEADIGSHILKNTINNPNNSKSLNLIMPYKKDNNVVAILTNPIFYRENKNANLEDFIVEKLPEIKSKSSQDSWSIAFSTGLAISLAQLTNEMFQGLSNLHRNNVLHLDTACRNFLVAPPEVDINGNIVKLNLMLSDYGISGKMDDDRSVNTTTIQEKAPLRFYDQNAVSYRYATNSTDFFAMKTTLTEMLGFTAGGKDNTQFIKFPNLDVMRARFLDNPPFEKDNDALAIYLKNVEALLPNCPSEIRGELALFITCYRDYLVHLDDSNLKDEVKSNLNKESLLRCNEKFVKEMFNLKHDFLQHLATPFSDKELLIRRLLSVEVSPAFKTTETYKQLEKLHLECQKTNNLHFTELLESHSININPLNSLDLSQRQTQAELIHKLSRLDVSETFRNEETYQKYNRYLNDLHKSNSQFIKNNLQSMRETIINIDNISKPTIETAYSHIKNLQKINLQSDFANTETGQKLLKYQKRIELVLNELKIKQLLESKLPPIANLKILDEKSLKDNTLIASQLLSMHVRKRFIESDMYQSLLNYQKTIMSSYVEKHITNLMTELEKNTSFKDGKQSSFYNIQKQKYAEALANINNELNDGKYLNLRQVQKILLPIDKVVNNEIGKRVAEQKAIEKRLSDYSELENSIKDELKQYKWIFFERDTQSKDPHILAILQLKNKLDEYRDQIKKGEFKQLDPVKKSLNELRDDINAKLLEKQNKAMETKNSSSVDKSLPTQQNIETIDNSHRKRF